MYLMRSPTRLGSYKRDGLPQIFAIRHPCERESRNTDAILPNPGRPVRARNEHSLARRESTLNTLALASSVFFGLRACPGGLRSSAF